MSSTNGRPDAPTQRSKRSIVTELRELISLAAIRLTPIPYSLVNLITGASKTRFFDFVAGTALGLVPVIGLLAGLAVDFDERAQHSSLRYPLALIAAAIVVLAAT